MVLRGEDSWTVSASPGPTLAPREVTLKSHSAAALFALAVVVPTVVGLTLYTVLTWSAPKPDLIYWLILIAAVEMLPAPAWGGIQVSLGFPLLTAVAIVFSPGSAALIAFLGASDPREWKREINPLRTLFNRSQVSLAVLAASATFHALSGAQPPYVPPLVELIPPALVATVVDYAVNIGLVTVAASLIYRLPMLRVLRQISRGQEFLVSYVGLGLVGTVLAKLSSLPEVGLWSVVVVLAPLLFARQMFIRSQALEEAHKELQEREQVLKTLSNAMAEERSDERLQIAGYLHDDLAQVLFRLSIQVDVARKLMDKGEYRQVNDQLEKIRESKQETSERIRALIRDLHRSPLGAKGLAEALESFTDEVGRDSGVVFHRDVEEIDLPAPIALLVYHIAREGVMNSLKHARATDMWIAVRETGDNIELELRDNGVGFDTNAPGPEGHFGMAMMRERAQVGGGDIEVQSTPGEGATITVRFPVALLQQARQAEAEAPKPSSGDDDPGADASPDTSGGNGRAAADSRQTVRA
jgi:signal transduction histidine kinase